MTPKLIVVLGATGNQGGSVVDTFLQQAPTWEVRGITRKKSSSKALELSMRGVQVVEADMTIPSTLDIAFEGASAIFAVSDFLGIYHDPANKTKAKAGQALNAWAANEEERQLKNVIVAAAKVSGLERFVLSSLANVTKWSNGKYKHVYHFDGKANAEEYGRREHLDLWAKTSVIQEGIFLNLYKHPAFEPYMSEDGTVEIASLWKPETKLQWIVPYEDTGPLVKALLGETPGKSLHGYRQFASAREIAAALTRVTGHPTRVKPVPVCTWADSTLLQEMTEHRKYWEEFGFDAQKDPPMIHPSDLQTHIRLPSIEEWLEKQEWSKA